MTSVAAKMARPFTALGRWYNNAAQSRPVVTAVVTTGLKTSAADLFAQKVRRGEREKNGGWGGGGAGVVDAAGACAPPPFAPPPSPTCGLAPAHCAREEPVGPLAAHNPPAGRVRPLPSHQQNNTLTPSPPPAFAFSSLRSSKSGRRSTGGATWCSAPSASATWAASSTGCTTFR